MTEAFRHVEPVYEQKRNVDVALSRAAHTLNLPATTPLTIETRVSRSLEKPLANSHILVVEDNLINQKVLV